MSTEEDRMQKGAIGTDEDMTNHEIGHVVHRTLSQKDGKSESARKNVLVSMLKEVAASHLRSMLLADIVILTKESDENLDGNFIEILHQDRAVLRKVSDFILRELRWGDRFYRALTDTWGQSPTPEPGINIDEYLTPLIRKIHEEIDEMEKETP